MFATNRPSPIARLAPVSPVWPDQQLRIANELEPVRAIRQPVEVSPPRI